MSRPVMGRQWLRLMQVVYCYKVWDCVWSVQEPHSVDIGKGNDASLRGYGEGGRGDDEGRGYATGDTVWIRQSGNCCTAVLQTSMVTIVNLPQVVEDNGVPWHVRDLIHCNCTLNDLLLSGVYGEDDSPPLYIDVQHPQQAGALGTNTAGSLSGA